MEGIDALIMQMFALRVQLIAPLTLEKQTTFYCAFTFSSYNI